jgi:hypothetical protein
VPDQEEVEQLSDATFLTTFSTSSCESVEELSSNKSIETSKDETDMLVGSWLGGWICGDVALLLHVWCVCDVKRISTMLDRCVWWSQVIRRERQSRKCKLQNAFNITVRASPPEELFFGSYFFKKRL